MEDTVAALVIGTKLKGCGQEGRRGWNQEVSREEALKYRPEAELPVNGCTKQECVHCLP